MTKKHFTAIAAAFNRAHGHAMLEPNPHLAIIHLAHAMADICQASNPRFDRERFLSACGVACINAMLGQAPSNDEEDGE